MHIGEIKGRLRKPTTLEKDAFMTNITARDQGGTIGWLELEHSDVDWSEVIAELEPADKKFAHDCLDVLGIMLDHEAQQ